MSYALLNETNVLDLQSVFSTSLQFNENKKEDYYLRYEFAFTENLHESSHQEYRVLINIENHSIIKI